IVDDNATNRRILVEILSSWGMKPVPVDDAQKALDLLLQARQEGTPFRLLVTDVNMPDYDGFDLARWVRDDPSLADTVIIMLTSSGRPGDSARRAALRIAANLMKPVKQSELFDAIVEALGVTAAEDEAEHEVQWHAAGSPTTPLRIL